MYNAWPWPVTLWQRVLRASTWFSLNHLPAGNHALTLLWLLWAYSLSHSRNIRLAVASVWCSITPDGLGEIELKILQKILDVNHCLVVYWCACDHLCGGSASHHEIQLRIRGYVSCWFDLHSTCHALCYVWFRSQVEAANHCAKIMWLNVSGLAAPLKANKWTPNDAVWGSGINICYNQNACGKEKWGENRNK